MSRIRVSSIAFELTMRCNLRCHHCYNASHGALEPASQPDLVLRRMARICEEVELGHATLTGGEPLLFPRLIDALALLRERNVTCQIISNGLALNDTMASSLARAGVRSIQLSLHAPVADGHEEYTGVPGSHAKTIDGVRAAMNAGLPVVGCIVVTRRNARGVGATLQLWKSLGVSRVALSRFSPAGLAANHAAELMPSVPDVIEAFDQALPYARDGMQLYCTMPLPPCAFETRDYAPIRFGSCSVGTSKQEFALGPGGALRNCTLHQTPIGGVTDILQPGVDIASLFRHPDVTAYRACIPEFCLGCLYASSCGGGCGAASMSVLRPDRSLPDPFLWQHLGEDEEGGGA